MMETCPRWPLSLSLLELSVLLLSSTLPHYPVCYKKPEDGNTQEVVVSTHEHAGILVVERLVG